MIYLASQLSDIDAWVISLKEKEFFIEYLLWLTCVTEKCTVYIFYDSYTVILNVSINLDFKLNILILKAMLTLDNLL